MKQMTMDIAMELLKKKENKENLTKTEAKELGELLAWVNETLAERKVAVKQLEDYLRKEVPRTVAVEGTVNFLINMIENDLKVELKDGEHGDAIIELYNQLLEHILPETVRIMFSKGGDVNASNATEDGR